MSTLPKCLALAIGAAGIGMSLHHNNQSLSFSQTIGGTSCISAAILGVGYVLGPSLVPLPSWLITALGIGGTLLYTDHLNLLQLIGGSVCLAGGLVALIYLGQEQMLYQPKALPQYTLPHQNPPGYRHPSEGEHLFYSSEDVTLETTDGVVLSCWFIKQEQSTNVPTILFFTGNAGNIGFRLPNYKMLYHETKCNILAVSYRGYGASTGQPSEAGLLRDAETALMHLSQRNDIDKNRIILFGRSLGGAVAIGLAHRHSTKIAATVVENTFLSISRLVDRLFPFLVPLKPYLLRLEWNNESRVQAIRHPILFISGERDELIPSFHMEQLYEKAQQTTTAQLYKVSNGTHNDTWLKGGQVYFKKLADFFNVHRRQIEE